MTPTTKAQAGAGAAALTPAVVARLPPLGVDTPQSVQFSPDERQITFLWSAESTLNRRLWAFDVESGESRELLRPAGPGDTEASVSREEALRRERQRQRGEGITTYAWAAQGDTLLVPQRGGLQVQHGAGGTLQRVVAGTPPCIDPQLNHDGSAVAFVRNGELYTLDLMLPDAVPLRLTFDASPPSNGEQLVTNGLAEFVAQEELGRQHGYWWSPDSRFLAYTQVDNSPVTPYTIVHQGGERPDTEVHRYPFAGEANARVRLGIVHAAGGATTWLPLPGVAGAGGTLTDGYLARVDWTPDARLLVQVLSRDQRRLELRRLDPASDSSVTLLSETAPDWVNLHDDLRIIRRYDSAGERLPADCYELLWSAQRPDARQLFLYDRDGVLLRRLSPGPWPVDAVVGSDDRRRLVYFLGAESPLACQVWRASLDGPDDAAERLTDATGMHGAMLAPSGNYWVERYNSLQSPPVFTLHRAHGGELPRTVFRASRSAADSAGLQPPALVTLPSRDGVELHAAIWRPPVLEPGRRYPVLVEVYGGPHVQLVADSWALTCDLRAQYLARHGFIVFSLDNRGSARRGHAFEAALAGRMGTVEVRDQVDGVRYLAANVPEADTARVGVYGWSYGGYLTLMCLLKAPDIFKAGVAGAPVTSWDGYDTCYTERYMQTPLGNPAGYRDGSALTHAAALQGKLLLLHGLLDENVHFRHTARLINALNEADKPYELALYPNERHGPRGEAQRAALERRLAEFFRLHLAG